MSLRERARQIAYLPQHPIRPDDCTVEGLVRLGRFPHRDGALFESPEDRRVVQAAMERMNVACLAHRTVASLSGGESQRAHLAAALAQQTKLLALDEPSAGLDLYHQLAIFDLLRQQGRDHGLTVIAVIHDLNLANQYADQVILLDGGRCVAVGTAGDVLDPARLGAIYRVRFARVQAGDDAPPNGWLLCMRRQQDEGVPPWSV
jgi:iron complex transport system ATP-binding protein